MALPQLDRVVGINSDDKLMRRRTDADTQVPFPGAPAEATPDQENAPGAARYLTGQVGSPSKEHAVAVSADASLQDSPTKPLEESRPVAMASRVGPTDDTEDDSEGDSRSEPAEDDSE